MVAIKGFFRVKIEENGKLAGDSGWIKNCITETGFNAVLLRLGGHGNSHLYYHYCGIGTGAVPSSTAVVLPGEILDASNRSKHRMQFVSSAIGSHTLRLTASFDKTDSFITATGGYDISNFGIYAQTYTQTSGGSQGWFYAGGSFASSHMSPNQTAVVSHYIEVG